jgi:hypothetical protein
LKIHAPGLAGRIEQRGRGIAKEQPVETLARPAVIIN